MKTKAKPVPMVTKWWTVVRRMQSGTIGMESVGPVKALKDEKPYAMMPWNYFRAMQRIVRMDAKKGCTRLVQRADKDNPMVIGFYDCGKCAPCLARAIVNRKDQQ